MSGAGAGRIGRDEGGERAVNGGAPIVSSADAEWMSSSWRIRAATHADVSTLVAGVRELLLEIGGTPAPDAELEQAAHTLIDDEHAGLLLVADNEGEIIGVLGMSWQFALRVPGRYGLIQELWVHPSWRGQTVGGDLLVALFEIARRRGVARLEVGLPGERFAHLDATEAFYLNNGFTTIGTRMRRLL
jgi:GNAT superfamily N-acetyltransferase